MGDDNGPRHIANALQGKLQDLQEKLVLMHGGGDEIEPVANPVHSSMPTSEETTAYAARLFARLFAQLYLPYRDPGPTASWSRTNGAITLTIRPGQWLDADGAIREGYQARTLPG